MAYEFLKLLLGCAQLIFQGVTHVICCTGTTAFPSRRWDGDNTPERVDWDGVRNLVSALPKSLKRIVLVSSIGVTKFNELPWSIMNLFGVLKYKKMGEDFVRNSGLPFTIIRAGRLTDGPYTSYDLNTLLQATAGERRAVLIGQGDKLVGEVSRLVVAEACIQALDIDFTEGQTYEVNSIPMKLSIYRYIYTELYYKFPSPPQALKVKDEVLIREIEYSKNVPTAKRSMILVAAAIWFNHVKHCSETGSRSTMNSCPRVSFYQSHPTRYDSSKEKTKYGSLKQEP
uniref:NAD(P)-binding domain-containing protein n=1 Tax=Solanum lycopersicum TaxID=4081 RepID=A0A3Q7EA43_SOLLC